MCTYSDMCTTYTVQQQATIEIAIRNINSRTEHREVGGRGVSGFKVASWFSAIKPEWWFWVVCTSSYIYAKDIPSFSLNLE